MCNREGARPGILKCEKEEDDGISCDGLHVTADSVYDCEGYRLPTESEWEYAARAGTGGAFWTGDITPEPVLGECAPDANLEPIAWYCHNSGKRQHPVGKKPANPWGLHDVLGNVEEWTSDAIYWLGYGDGPLVDPSGYWWEVAGKEARDLMPLADYGGKLVKQDTIINRGGNYLFPAASTKVSRRNYLGLVYQGTSALGFRMVRTLAGPASKDQ